jgi:pyrophosphatase PpaX
MDDREVARYRSIPSREVLKRLAPDRIEELLDIWLAYQHELLHETRLFPGIIDLLDRLSQAGLAIGVVTGQNKSELDATRRHIAIDDLIHTWISADDAPFPKPHPSPVRVALNEFGCPPPEAIMIGDSHLDIQAGRTAGTLVGAAIWSVQDPAPLLGLEPDYIFNDPLQIKSLVHADPEVSKQA